MSGIPVVNCKELPKPPFLFRFKIILMIPPVPSASYFADGLVITSTFSILSEGIDSNPLLAVKTEGFPLINIRTLEFPRKLTAPSISTLTDGTLFKISLTEPPFEIKSFPTLKTRLSNLYSVVDFSAITSISSNA